MTTESELDLFAPPQDTLDPVIDPDKNYYAELVGEGKKYKTENDLAKTVVYKDSHIARIERENAEYREQIKVNKRLEDLVDRLSKVNPNQPTTSGDNQPGANEGDFKGLTPEQINQILDQRLTEREKTSRRDSNLREVKNQLQGHFGQNYPNKLREQAATLGLTEDYLKLLASEQPKAFYRLMNMEQVRSPVDSYSPPNSSVSSEGFRPNVTGEKTKSYYENLRKTQPALYKTAAIQNEEYQNAIRLGERFFDTD